MQIPTELQAVAAVFCHAPEGAIIIDLPPRNFHKYVKEGLFPSYKIGRHRFFKKDELIEAIQKCRVGTKHEVLS